MEHAVYNIRVKPTTTAKKLTNDVQFRDTFETPAYAVDLLTPFLPHDRPITIWEPAAGNGRIVKRLQQTVKNATIIASDLRQTPFIASNGFVHNFLSDYDLITALMDKDMINGEVFIVTNPPYSIKEEFIKVAFSYKFKFAFLINADYSGNHIEWIKRGCEKIIPTRRIDYIIPLLLERINADIIYEDIKDKFPVKDAKELVNGGFYQDAVKMAGSDKLYKSLAEVPDSILVKYSSSQAHSMWLTYGFNLGSSEVFVDLPSEFKKTRILWEKLQNSSR